MAESSVFNCDCIEYMRSLPDNFFDLAVADPPYGSANSDALLGGGGDSSEQDSKDTFNQPIQRWNLGEQIQVTANKAHGGRFARYEKFGGVETPQWDITPPQEYFDQLFRVAKNQIIWGGNYFTLPPTRCFLVWKKHIPEQFTMAMCEYAWTSFNGNAKLFEFPSTRKEYSGKFHPTEKPIELYQWILRNYANKGDKIFDPNMGSQNSRLAAYSLGFDYFGCEINEYYFNKGNENFDRNVKGIIKGKNGKEYIQQSLF